MRCEPCYGSGQKPVAPTPVQIDQAVGLITWIVCPECRGSGVVSCCEGMERQAGVAGVEAQPWGMGR